MSGKYSIDFKVTTWERFIISNKEDYEKILKKFKEEDGNTNDDVYETIDHVDLKTIKNTIEEMTIEDNDGENTIEIMNNGVCVWGNATSMNEGDDDA